MNVRIVFPFRKSKLSGRNKRCEVLAESTYTGVTPELALLVPA